MQKDNPRINIAVVLKNYELKLFDCDLLFLIKYIL